MPNILRVSLLILAVTHLHGFSATKKTSLIYGETGRLSSFDPYTAHEASGHRLSDLLFDGLVIPGPGGSYKPGLAQKWDIRKGGSEVIVTLRDGVRWHRLTKVDSGSYKVSPEDLITTLRLLKNKKSQIPNSDRFSIITGAKKLDNRRVLFSLARATVDPMRYLMFKVLPDHILGSDSYLKRDSEFSKHPIGTGPYKFQSYRKSGEVVLLANDEYYAGAPKIKYIIMKNFADQNIMSQSLMYGSLDLVTYVSPRSLDEVMGDRRLGVVPYDALSYSFIALNTQSGALKDKRVRQAMSYAVNRQEMLNAFFYGKGKIISGPFAPTSWAYNIDVKPFDFDRKKAEKLLKSANIVDSNNDGIREFKGKPIELEFVVPLAGESEILKRIVLAYQGYLSDVGIKVNLKFLDWLVWKDRVLKDRKFDLTIASWSFDDAANITSLFHTKSIRPWGNNFVGFSNPNIDELLHESANTANFDKRRSIAHKLHALLAEESPYTYLWTLEHHAAHSRRVSGVRVEPFSFFKHVKSWGLDKNNRRN